MSETALITVKQLPVIEERLKEFKEVVQAKAEEANSLVCTEENLQTIKKYRAELRKEFDELERQRKAVKNAVFEPYERFEAVYIDCVSGTYRELFSVLKHKIDKVESGIKSRCEDSLKDYFDELCVAHGIDWLTYDRAGIKVDMTSATQKTPNKLREKLVTFVVNVAQDLETIDSLEYADEILVEYKRSLDAVQAIGTVQDRHQRVEAERGARAERVEAREKEAKREATIEALAPAVVNETPVEEMASVTFTITDTIPRLKALKIWLRANNYEYS